MITCKECGHSIDNHGWAGCWYHVGKGGVCSCILRPSKLAEQAIAELESKVRALPDRVPWHPQWGRDDWRNWFRNEIRAALSDSAAPETEDAPPPLSRSLTGDLLDPHHPVVDN